MREILFRGKRIDNNKWVEGYYYKSNTSGCCILTPKLTAWKHDSKVIGYKFEVYKVIPKSIGQFTEICDKNGKKIFEGDIVRITDEHESIYDCNCGVGDIQFKYGHWYVLGKPQNSLWDLCDCYYCEVIGNIHDNPELLKEHDK